MKTLKYTESTLSIENVSFDIITSNVIDDDANREKCNAQLHNHVASEVFACLQGEINIVTESETVVLRSGDVAIVTPLVLHYMKPSESAADVKIFCFGFKKKKNSFTNDVYSVLFEIIKQSGIVIYRNRVDICNTVAKITDALSCERSLVAATEAVNLLIGIHGSEKLTVNLNSHKSDSFDVQRMIRLDDIIGSKYMQDLKIKDVSDELFVSVRQLNRIIEKRYGCSFHRLLIKRRIQTAERMLKETAFTVEQIAKTVGFTSLVSFYKAFSAEYGTTPAAYRKG